MSAARPWLRPAVVAALVALALRLTYLLTFDPGVGLLLDQARFLEQAQAIRAGEGPGAGPYLTSPLYPYVVALLEGATRMTQVVLGAGTAGLAALTAGRRFGAPAGWVTGLALATLAPALHYEVQILVAGPLAFLLTVALALEPDEAGRRGGARGLAAGVALGLAAALRPTALVPAVALGLVTLARGRRRAAGALALGAALAVLPFTLRNATVGGEPVLLSAGGGFNLWVGNHPGAPGVFEAPPGYDFALDPVGVELARRTSGRELSAAEASAWWRERALEGMSLALFGRKALLLFHPEEIPQLGPDDLRPAREESLLLRGPLDGRWLLLAALLAPFALARDRARLGRAAAPLAMAAAYAAVVVLFFVSGRFRFPLLPPAAVLAGGGVAALAGLGRPRQVALGVAAVGLGLLSAYVYRPDGPYGLGEARTRAWEARTLARRGLHAEAAAAFRELLEEDPTHARAALDLARLRMGPLLGEDRAEKVETWRECVALLERALAQQPDLAEAWFFLGVARLNLGRREAARAALEEALERGSPADAWRSEAERARETAGGG